MSFRPNRYTALIDACVLVSALKCNFILSFAEAEYFRLRWSEKILNETERALAKLITRKGVAFDIAKIKAAAKLKSMRVAFDDVCVEDFQDLESGLKGINEKDRHVLAAAIQTSAAAIVTDNLKHFPRDYCENFDVEPLSTDEFIANIITLHPVAAIQTIHLMRTRLKKPEMSPEWLIRSAEKEAMFETASLMEEYKLSL
ncbi:PIN domain-containing protein [Sulfitobacter sp. G21635-S1]|uniref:PIN domain-containing protein n=1 Tax=Sulfitobacter sp. G21635-S1 TaxID=3014043 RepID=UPI0022B02326|nr:PIN domain-containing protein [Sulfitobacter sp. G21635-S1]